MAVATLVNMLGRGTSLTGGVLFLIRVAGLPAAEGGVGLTVAGLAALAAGVAIGDAATGGARGASTSARCSCRRRRWPRSPAPAACPCSSSRRC